MSLIVEDGTGVPNAESYVSISDADEHFAALENSSWTRASSDLKENALKNASAYSDLYSYPGYLLNAQQGLKWPRAKAYDQDGRRLLGLPTALRAAVLELAAEMINKSAAETFRRPIREKVGPLELVYSNTQKQPSFVFRLLMKIGARPYSITMQRG